MSTLRSNKKANTGYPRIYRVIKHYGHSPFQAGNVVIDLKRKYKHAQWWFKVIWSNFRSLPLKERMRIYKAETGD